MWKKSILVIVVILISLTLFSQKTHRIGFSQCSGGDWRNQMEKEMQQELMFHPTFELITKYAKDSAPLQIKQINELVNEGIDLLIIAPIEIETVQPVVEELFKKGIPIVLIDRKIDSGNFTAYVGGDNYQIGFTAGMYITDKLNKYGKVIEILGALSSSPAKERMNGFESAILLNPGVSIVDRIYSNWNNQIVLDSLSYFLQKNPDVDAIFAHTDFLAAAAREVISEKFSNCKIQIIGVDGSPSAGGGVELVENHIIDATLIYPTGGKEAIVVASKILYGLSFKKVNLLPTTLIDERNVKITRLQYNNIENLQNDIARSKGMLDMLGGRYKKQQLLLIVTLVSLVLVVVMIFLLFIAYKNKKIANKSLEEQKEAISIQNDELKRMSEQLQEATQARMQFYTNISHEFRTPLTLIVGPLEKIVKSAHPDDIFYKDHSLMYRNASRLLRLINQLMDFRKIEVKQMKLSTGEYDIVAFIDEIRESFRELTEQKEIDIEVNSQFKEYMLWFDWDKLDKVMFNLLSNAFKFTPQGGKIQIFIAIKENHASSKKMNIVVRDNGEGIPEKDLEKIFDRFYQVEKSNSMKGTGIGLSLSKELIDLHQGNIEVESKLGEGTAFTLTLPLGNSHLSEECMIDGVQEKKRSNWAIEGILEPQTSASTDNKSTVIELEEKPQILVVEDEPEVREYICSCFGNGYKVLEAENGADALEIMQDESPDLIVSDVMMPKLDGLQLTEKIKSDLKFCHIPVILLTAKSSFDHMMEGLETGADSYIPKPFNKEHLLLRVNKLLEAKERIKEKYKETSFVIEEEKGISRYDKEFLKKLNNHINENKLQEKINVEELSKVLGMSRVHLYRKIKKITGLSVSEYVNTVKLQNSLPLLKTSGKTIAEIAYEVGYSSPSYFTKCFTNHYKISPSEFRNN